MAQPQFEYVPTGEKTLVYKIDRDVWPVYHYHPEIDILLILKNNGEFVSGDAIRPMEPGTLIMNGPNIPHALHAKEPEEQDWSRPAVAVIQFSPETLGEDFLARSEMSVVREFLDAAKRGFEFHGATRQEAAKRIMAMEEQDDVERVASLLLLLRYLAQSDERSHLASQGYSPSLRPRQIKRVDRVIRFLQEHKSEPLTLDQVASHANLSPQAFCRFFKASTGKTLIQYLHELRIGEACRLLLETDWPIATIAEEVGFANLSNFNRRFRLLKGMTPREFRQKRVTLERIQPMPEFRDVRG